MIVEFINNLNIPNKGNSIFLKQNQRYLVLEIVNNLARQEVFYQILFPEDDSWISYNDSVSVDWSHFRIVNDKIPSNWIFECFKRDNSFRSVLTPAKWASKEWTYGFAEACYCWGDTGYEKLGSEEQNKAQQVFIEEAKKIYEECGKGWIPNPFEE